MGVPRPRQPSAIVEKERGRDSLVVGGDQSRKERERLRFPYFPRIWGIGVHPLSDQHPAELSAPVPVLVYYLFPADVWIMDRPTPLSLRSLVTPVTNSALSLALFLHSAFILRFSTPRPRPPSRFPSRFLLSTLRIARGCFLSIFANRRDLKSKKQQPSPSPSIYQSFPPLGRRFLSLFLLYFFSSFMFPLKENLPCDPAKSARAFYVPDDPHGIVSRSSARGRGGGTDAGYIERAYPGNDGAPLG